MRAAHVINVLAQLPGCPDSEPALLPQRALLEQKQRRKRQEPLMVQPNTEVRPRRARTRRGEEQAPLVESQLSVASDVIMDGEGVTPATGVP